MHLTTLQALTLKQEAVSNFPENVRGYSPEKIRLESLLLNQV